MDYFAKIPQECLEILKKAGWSEERRVDVTDKVSTLGRSGWDIFPLAYAFLESTDGLPEIKYPLIHHSLNGFEFNCLHGDYDRENSLGWEKRYNKRLFPIGRLHDLFMMIDQDGIIYATDSFEIIFSLGDSVESCFKKLMFFGHRVIDLSPL